VRIHTHEVLKTLARERNESMLDMLDRLAEEARRSRLMEKASEAYAAVAADPDADAAWRAEIALWDVTVADGLAPESDSSQGSLALSRRRLLPVRCGGPISIR
jgi:hypothetical protein